MHSSLHIRTMNHSHFPVVLGVGEPPPQQRQKFTIERIALVNWKNGTKTLFWQEEEGNHEGGSGQLFVVWCLGNAFTCKVKAYVNFPLGIFPLIRTGRIGQVSHADSIFHLCDFKQKDKVFLPKSPPTSHRSQGTSSKDAAHLT